jgi:hypothetical protein
MMRLFFASFHSLESLPLITTLESLPLIVSRRLVSPVESRARWGNGIRAGVDIDQSGGRSAIGERIRPKKTEHVLSRRYNYSVIVILAVTPLDGNCWSSIAVLLQLSLYLPRN